MAIVALAAAPVAQAKSFSLPGATVTVTVEPDGVLAVSETITFLFDGSFSGAFREIPLEPGQSITDVAVLEGEQAYAPGASAELGSSGDPGTFGTTRTGDGVRVVWHYRADGGVRTFTVRYRFSGLAVAYDDVVDVNLKVWGDEWAVRLESLDASLFLPRPPPADSELLVWGHPVFVRGDVERYAMSAHLRARAVPAGQFVELRVVFPREVLESVEGARVRPGLGRDAIVAAERADAARFERDRQRIDDAVDHIGRTIAILLGLALLPAAAVIGATWWLFGRERRTAYDRDYEQEPPSDLEPALVPPLLRQSPAVGSLEFTATLFDLIRRGRYTARPVTTEVRKWLVSTEPVADLELARGENGNLTAFEQPVATVVDDVVATGPERLTKFRERIADKRTTNAKRFESFKKHVAAAIGERRWFVGPGLALLVPALVVLLLAGGALLWVGIDGFRPVFPRWRDVVLIAVGVCLLVNAAILLVALTRVRLWRRRLPAAEAEAERWEAFRRYLTDFPRLHEAPPASLELWERYLVYGIAFGIAERVLQAAHLAMPKELHDRSSIYWISPHGDLGSGPSALAIGDLSSGFGSALSPPSSGGGGGAW